MDRELFVEGPISLTELYSDQYDKIVYIFGEKHMLHNCDVSYVSIDQFLKDWVSNSRNMIDIFLEYEFVSKEEPKREQLEPEHATTRIAKIFERCLEVDKSNCEYSNLRIHYADIRRGFFMSLALMLISFIETMMVTYNNNFYPGLVKRLKLDHFIIINSFRGKFPIKIENEVLFSKIMKQIKNVENESIRSDLTNFLKLTIAEMNSSWLKYKNSEVQNLQYGNNFATLAYITDKITDLIINIMDIYVLARIFRKFSDGTEPKNIIIYAGQLHANNYKKFLLDHSFKISNIHDREGLGVSCIDISKFLPLKF